MKKNFISKSLIAKIALVLVIILLFEFAAAEPVHAASLGGQLLNPIVNLVVYLADGAIQILQSALTSIENTFIYIDITESKTSWWIAVGAVVVGIICVVLAVVAVVVTGGLAAPAIVCTVAVSVAGAGLTAAAAGGIYLAVYPQFGEKLDAVVFGNSFVYSNIYITPETILKNQIQLFNVNYFETIDDSDTDTTVSLSNTLRKVISQAYTTVRDIALVAMLIVIIYVAIRMLLALTPKEKSRYKESAVNCVIGLILIVVMHFIMSASVTGLEMMTNAISITNQIYQVEGDDIEGFLASNPDVYDKSISGVSLAIVGDQLYDAVENPDSEGTSMYDGIVIGYDDNGDKISYVKASNFTEQARYLAQKLYTLDSDSNTVETWEHIGWAFVYIMLVVLTLAFVVMYGKRTLYMMVLTMFAPVVGVMYPINRANGSRAHTLNLWFREYMGNLIIQPLHVFLYLIFIGSAMAMAINNPIYVIMAIMGLTFAERLLKDLLGIQDTRIGGLGKSLQDTTRAIKTTEKAATSIARTVGRTVSRGTHALGGALVAGAAAASSKNNGESASEENEEANKKVREQQNPLPSGENGGNNLPPPTAGAQNPTELENELDNGTNQQGKPQKRQLDEVASMQKYMSQGGSVNANGEFFNPYTDEYDPNYNPLNDKEFQVLKDVNESATMQNYMNAGYGQNAIGEYYNPNIDEYDAGYNPLNDDMFREYGNTGVLDNDTMSMINDLNGNSAPFTVLEGTNERVVRTDRDRNVLRDDDGNVRIEPANTPDGRDPMAMAMAAGAETSTSVGAENTGAPRTVGNTDTPIENRGGASTGETVINNSGAATFGIPGGSQSIPDGNNSSSSDNSSKVRTANENTGNEKITSYEEGRKAVEARRNNNTGTDSSNNGNNTGADNNAESGNSQSSGARGTSLSSSNNVNNAGANSTGNGNSQGSRTSGTNTSSNDNGNTTGADNSAGNENTQAPEKNGTSAGSSNNANGTGSNNSENKKTQGSERTARRVQKAMDAVGTVTGRAANVVEEGVAGVIDTVLNATTGNIGGTADAIVGTASGMVGAATGTQGKAPSGGGKTSADTPSKPSKRVSQNVQTIMKDAGLSEQDARAVESACKRFRINDDRNMAEVGKVWKKASEGDKSKIFELSQILIEVKRDRGSQQDAEKALQNARVGSTTKDLLLKMYKNLHG